MGSRSGSGALTLDAVRSALIRQEDTIIFNLIERSQFPLHSPTTSSFSDVVRFFVKETEAIQSKVGRFESPDEVPFFPANVPHSNCTQGLPPAAASVNVSQKMWDIYFNQLLPLVASKGHDVSNSALSLASDLACLQAISKRIHYGKWVAEVKFTAAPQDYSVAIRDKDRGALMSMLTDEKVEEMVKKRVEKKAMVFGQDIDLGPVNVSGAATPSTKYKVDPAVVARLYGEWIIPLTKEVEVEYLLRRLD